MISSARGTECECGIILTCTQLGQSLPECEKIVDVDAIFDLQISSIMLYLFKNLKRLIDRLETLSPKV